MKCDTPVPYEKLAFFKKQLGLDENEIRGLQKYRDLFIDKKEEFSQFFYQYFFRIPETRIILEHERRHGRLVQKIWPHWFESLFKEKFDERFLAYIWRSGLRHVEENIDQRFINLGYSVVRQFCQQVARKEVPQADLEPVLVSIDKMVDLCLLIETNAYIMGTSQCDLEVVKGLAHQVRNPITVIGGNIIRLQKNVAPGNPTYKVYDMIMKETKRLERMIVDTGVYSEMFGQRATFSEGDLGTIISLALKKLKGAEWPDNLKVDIDLDPEHPRVQGDPNDLERMFFYLLQNSIESVDDKHPYIKISSMRVKSPDSPFIKIEIFNTGIPLDADEVENLFAPFYSSKPYGTGFGLPIAQLAAKKCLGELSLEPVPNKGTKCVIWLPIPIESLSRN